MGGKLFLYGIVLFVLCIILTDWFQAKGFTGGLQLHEMAGNSLIRIIGITEPPRSSAPSGSEMTADSETTVG